MPLNILFIGDVVGSPGRKIVAQALPRLIRRWDLGLVVCNAENSAGGSGLTIKCHEELADAGVDVFTLGDHAYRKDEVFTLFDRYRPDPPGGELRRPTPPAASRWSSRRRTGRPWGCSSMMGRTFMKPVDDPFRAADRVLAELERQAKVIVVDHHAEATSDKQLLGRYLDGRVSAVLGTHTHVATADEQILPNGTAYQSDVGMTGPYDSILGRRYDRVLASDPDRRPPPLRRRHRRPSTLRGARRDRRRRAGKGLRRSAAISIDQEDDPAAHDRGFFGSRWVTTGRRWWLDLFKIPPRRFAPIRGPSGLSDDGL